MSSCSLKTRVHNYSANLVKGAQKPISLPILEKKPPSVCPLSLPLHSPLRQRSKPIIAVSTPQFHKQEGLEEENMSWAVWCLVCTYMCDVTLASRYLQNYEASRGVLCPGTIAPRDLACMHGDLQAEECALIWPGVPFYDKTGTGPLRENTPLVHSLLCFNLMVNRNTPCICCGANCLGLGPAISRPLQVQPAQLP
jgi:hypothetical protein